MARFLVALFAATVIAVQAGQLGHAAPSTAEVFWRAVLPGSPLPDTILRLLRPADTNGFVSKAEVEVPFNYQDYKLPSDDDYREDSIKRVAAAAATRAGDAPFNYAYGGSDKRPGAAAGTAREFDYDDYSGAEKRRGATVGDSPFQYSYKAQSKSHGEERRGAVVGEPPFLYAYKAPSKSHVGERRGAVVGEPPFLYAYKAPSKSHVGERRGAVVGEPPFLYAYKAPSKSHVGKRPGAVVGEPPFLYAYKAPSTSEAGERRGAVVGEPPFLYAYKAPRTSQAGGERRGATAGDSPFQYSYKAPSKSHMVSGASGAASRPAATTTVFFHEEAVLVGERLPFHFPPATTSALGFMPRRVADSIPFTTPALPGVLAMLGVAPGSAMAASMEATLRTCESPTIAGESKFCATSLEALVERAMAVLGTRDVTALTSTLPRAGAPLQAYTVRAVRPVEGGPSFVACHDEAYPYTVYRCHNTGPARAYMVEMEGARGGGAVTVATVCHTDTSLWNPEHVSFRFLGTKPGGAPVCHLMPYGHIIWAKNVKRSPA